MEQDQLGKKRLKRAALLIFAVQSICMAAADYILDRMGLSHNYYYLILLLFFIASWSYLYYQERK
ncbi:MULTISPECIES: hypothetical protein [unclassified Paenibacillus]|uniref:hypothetical protein n=1 Tax=unclassified Paenibacillus TaxID=185978 RepID=UPI00117CD994|nr:MULTISPECIES: hypothetical protein [unclassified Paenibacillus]MBE1446758.1 positive regulator of sigma E activity [Paenibacillus sp. OAS669]